MAEFNQPTEYEINKLELKGNDVRGIFLGLEIYENIVLGGITGRITIFDTDAVSFIEKNGIQFNEEISFNIVSASDEELDFTGWMNGVKDEMTKQQKKIYTIEFLSKSLRKNETVFINKAFRGTPADKPEKIAEDMSQELGVENIETRGEGEPMKWISNRRKPLGVMKYVMSHGVVSKTTSASNYKDETQQKAEGQTGFFFWETLDGHRFASGDELLKGAFNSWDGFENKIAKRSANVEETMKGIVDYEFPQIGDYQSKLRSGAFASKGIVMDLDRGEYLEQDLKLKWDGKPSLDDYSETSRYTYSLMNNESFSPDYKISSFNKNDPVRLYQQQSITRQNTMTDQHGRFTVPPQFKIRAGDTVEVKINKTCSEGGPVQYSKKHSGKYLVKQVGHHIFTDGRQAYTKITTLRSVEQQMDMDSYKNPDQTGDTEDTGNNNDGGETTNGPVLELP